MRGESAVPLSWTTPSDAVRLCLSRHALRRTIRIALVVGTILSLINQGGRLWGGTADAWVWLKVGLNYLVPFCVSSAGFLVATRSRDA